MLLKYAMLVLSSVSIFILLRVRDNLMNRTPSSSICFKASQEAYLFN